MSKQQQKEYWEKRRAEEKQHKKDVKEHWKRVGAETYAVSGQNVYKHMKHTKKVSKRLNNKKHRNPFMRKNKKLDKDPLFKRILYKLRKKKEKS